MSSIAMCCNVYQDAAALRYQNLSKPKFNSRFIDLSGRQFGKLTVLHCLGVRENRAVWLCECACGNTVDVLGKLLRNGKTKSCGCAKIDAVTERCLTHGSSKSAEFRIWAGMIQRCTNPKVQSWKYYGGRGIKVAPEWLDYEKFYKDVGPRPSPQHSIDRWPDKDGDYKPGNVRWATHSQQSRNSNGNRLIVFKGQTMSLKEASEKFGINYNALYYRLAEAGWSIERALTTPSKSK